MYANKLSVLRLLCYILYVAQNLRRLNNLVWAPSTVASKIAKQTKKHLVNCPSSPWGDILINYYQECDCYYFTIKCI